MDEALLLFLHELDMREVEGKVRLKRQHFHLDEEGFELVELVHEGVNSAGKLVQLRVLVDGVGVPDLVGMHEDVIRDDVSDPPDYAS